jgi:hypothetical protein
MHNIYYTTILDVIIQCELGREPGGQTSLPDSKLVLVSVNDINSFMTILIESYLDLDNSNRNILIKFRITAHNLEIEKGRHQNIPLNKRICKLCKLEIGLSLKISIFQTALYLGLSFE